MLSNDPFVMKFLQASKEKEEIKNKEGARPAAQRS